MNTDKKEIPREISKAEINKGHGIDLHPQDYGSLQGKISIHIEEPQLALETCLLAERDKAIAELEEKLKEALYYGATRKTNERISADAIDKMLTEIGKDSDYNGGSLYIYVDYIENYIEQLWDKAND